MSPTETAVGPVQATPSKEMIQEFANVCKSGNRRKVELASDGSKGDGAYLLLCGEQALLVKEAKVLHRIPIHITWTGNADHMPVHPAIKHLDLGQRELVTIQVDSAGDSETSKICSQILSVDRSRVQAGPGFCRAADSEVKQISVRDQNGEKQLIVTVIGSGRGGGPEAPPVQNGNPQPPGTAENSPVTVRPSPSPSQTATLANHAVSAVRPSLSDETKLTETKLTVSEIWNWHRSEWAVVPSSGHPSPAKYGKIAVPLALDHQFMREAPAPDYWALSPYYAAQKTDSACSIASVAMVINAARVHRPAAADEELATQAGLIKLMKNETWRTAVVQGGSGVSLEQLKTMFGEALKSSGFRKFRVEASHVDDTAPVTRQKLHQLLVENEGSDHNFIIANFSQGTYTGDVAVGHIAPVGAYDLKRARVLIMDPDRQWYEPYWVSEEVFLKGMATRDSATGRARGYVWVQVAD